MRERARLKFAARQSLLAKMARREAMAGFADAAREELRSDTLAERSKHLLAQYTDKPGHACAQDLRDLHAFAQSLGIVASQAEEAQHDASAQMQWHAQTLAEASARADAADDRLLSARRALSVALERREEETPRRVARKLQTDE
ncbi:hypothetical protein NAP1_14898 [Erythrobacter sp. NAP1]|uniref:hypothetical protein n=1 Tax=Erythrobacter sp. NAP1 TaxID=237727 RepID=UPI0000687742|nr:hypothetical protein [Erythrobacter sp. NAP1]EAQ28897.1 hypothetical protein NAP1_14898 [Erythrobacter sp. NAP1]